MPTQLSLMPEAPLVGALRHIGIDDERYGEQAVPAPANFLASVTSFGVLQPIVVIDRGPMQTYNVVAGRRRLWAARMAGLPTIPALVLPSGTSWAVASSITLSENLHRGPNVQTDLHALRRMRAGGATEEQIAEALHVTPAIVRRRLQLLGLIPGLMALFESGVMTVAAAEAASRLPTAEQQHVLSVYGDGLTVSARAIRERARELRAVQDSEAIPLPMPEPITAVPPPEPVQLPAAEVQESGSYATSGYQPGHNATYVPLNGSRGYELLNVDASSERAFMMQDGRVVPLPRGLYRVGLRTFTRIADDSDAFSWDGIVWRRNTVVDQMIAEARAEEREACEAAIRSEMRAEIEAQVRAEIAAAPATRGRGRRTTAAPVPVADMPTVVGWHRVQAMMTHAIEAMPADAEGEADQIVRAMRVVESAVQRMMAPPVSEPVLRPARL